MTIIEAYALVRHTMTVAAFAALVRQGWKLEHIVKCAITPAI